MRTASLPSTSEQESSWFVPTGDFRMVPAANALEPSGCDMPQHSTLLLTTRNAKRMVGECNRQNKQTYCQTQSTYSVMITSHFKGLTHQTDVYFEKWKNFSGNLLQPF